MVGNGVLIETLWNVKKRLPRIASFSQLRFNRNIVECKATSALTDRHTIWVLIETLWNVKLYLDDFFLRVNKEVLIETLWNVKD